MSRVVEMEWRLAVVYAMRRNCIENGIASSDLP